MLRHYINQSMKKMTEVFIMDLYLSYVTVKSDGFISIGTILK